MMDKGNDLEVIFLNDDYLVINKPYDMLINHTSNCEDEKSTVHTRLNSMFPHLINNKLKHGFHFVHRLDYSTSGLLCIGLNKRAAQRVSAAFSSRLVEKYYVAIVRGHVQNLATPVLSIQSDIGEDSRFSHRMCTKEDEHCVNPRKAMTKLLVLQLGLYNGQPASKVILKPITGRRHQLRIHCASVGHLIVGDYTYSEGKDTGPHRMYLHAIRLKMTLEEETLLFSTSDPFQVDDEKLWKVSEEVHQLSACYHLF